METNSEKDSEINVVTQDFFDSNLKLDLEEENRILRNACSFLLSEAKLETISCIPKQVFDILKK